MRELAPDCRSDLRHLLGRTQPIKPRHQRGVHLADDRVERAVRVLWGTKVAQAYMWFGSNTFEQRSSQSRFADARFTGEQYHLAPAGLRLRPTPKQQIEFFFPSDKLSQPARVESLEPALR